MHLHRKAAVALTATAITLGSIGVASATHQSDPNYSPCRPDAPEGELHLGYSDAGDPSDPRHELPTIYANGSQDTMSGYVGVCGGSGDDAQFVEVSGGAGEDPPVTITHSDPPALP